MKISTILYVPSDTPEAMVMATKKIAGVPLIVRGIMTLAQSGIERIALLIAESQRERITSFLSRYRPSVLPQIDIFAYDEPYRVSPRIIEAIASTMSDSCLLINANLIYEKEFVDLMKSFSPGSDEGILMEEGVHPLPARVIHKRSWEKLAKQTTDAPLSIESCIRKLDEGATQRHAAKSPAINTHLVTRHRDRAVAEKFLAEAIRLSTMGPIARYINKRISLPISFILSKLWVSPNTITAFNVLLGVFSGVFVADGHRYDVILLGAFLFQAASVIDGCDGEVAKLTFRCSKFGQYADSLSDNLSLASFITGLIAGYWRHTHAPITFVIGAVLVVSTLTIFFWMILFLKKNTNSASFVTFDKEFLSKLKGYPRPLILFINVTKYLLKKDMFSFLFLLSAVAGILYYWLFLAAFGTFIGAILLTYLSLKPAKVAAPVVDAVEART